MHMNSFDPTWIERTPGSLWKCGMPETAMLATSPPPVPGETWRLSGTGGAARQSPRREARAGHERA